MHPKDHKPVQVMHKLLQLNNRRLDGYQQAMQSTDVSVLQVLFERLTETSEHCRQELCRELYKLGGVPVEFKAGGDFDKVWRDIGSALERDDHRSLLDYCYIEEFMAYKQYEYALRYNRQFMNSQQERIFNRQLHLLRKDHKKVENLRQVLLAA